VLELAAKLKELGFDPVLALTFAVGAERRVKQRLPREQGEWYLDEKTLADLLRTQVGLEDALFSPTVAWYLSGLRSVRAQGGATAEARFEITGLLDRMARAVAVRTERGRPARVLRERMQDQIDYGTYLRIQSVMASELGLRTPRRGKLASLALIEIAWTRQEFEPHLSRQLKACRGDRKRGGLPLSDRAALVLLGMLRARAHDPTPITDAYVEEARATVQRLEHRLRRDTAPAGVRTS